MRFAAVLAVLLVALPLHAAWRNEGPYVGNVVDVAADPANPDTLYAATGSGGVWRSDDGGQHWMLPGNELVSRPVTWIAVDPGNPSTLWAGVHDPGNAGLWRSTDRGKNWAPVHPDKSSFILDQPIAFAPSNPSIVYAPSSNLHYRSADGGKTWESFRVPDQDAYAFAIDPKNPKIIYAGGRGSEHHMRRSTDGGKTWKPVGAGLPDRSIRLLAIPRERPSTIYVATGFGQLFKTEDSGQTWTELDLGLQGTESLFSLDLDPHDPQTLFAGTANGLRRSTDGGQSWATVGGGLDNWYCKGVAFHPKQRGTIYAGTTGKGFFKSTDNGDTFQPLNTGLGAGWAKKLYASASGPVFAQLSIGIFREDAPGAWSEIEAPFATGGDTAEVDGFVFDRQSSKRVYAHYNARWWRSEDAGKSWQQIEVPEPGMRDLMRGKIASPEFDGLAQDAGDAKIFYAGGSWSKDTGGAPVNRSSNGGRKWDAAGAGITGNVTMLRSPAPNVVIAVAGNDGVYRSTDGAKTFTLLRAGEINDLGIDPSKPERIYVATKQGLYRSSDNGATWSKATGVKDDEVEAVAVAPNGKVFCGTFDGVFMSADGGGTWTAFNDGLLNTDVRALAIGNLRLYAGTAGGSVQSIEIP